MLIAKTSAGNFALLMVYMVNLSSDVRKLLITLLKIENTFISFERCQYFMALLPEVGYHHLNSMLESYDAIVSNKPVRNLIARQYRADWPKSGSLEFRDFSVRYRPDLPEVLKQITFTLNSGQKLGILGRTGAGKSTLISSVFKYFEEFEGDLLYDGVSIRDIDLQQLRAAITIIPQDPVLLNGSVQKNLDPGSRYSSSDCEQVLKEVGLWEKVVTQGGLDYQIDGGGANLSQGEKQLICFGRALLQKSKLILMDEATASIDSQTEETMQLLIKEKFKGCTILMIAHRLHTVLICDQILILESGKIQEFGRLDELREKEDSILRSLLQSADLLQKYFEN